MMAGRILGPGGLTAFVPNGDSRKDTATILIGLARENGLDDATDVRATQGGFYVSDALVDLLSDEDGSEVETVEKGEGERRMGVQPDEHAADPDYDETTEGDVTEYADVDGEEEPEDSYDPADDNIEDVKAHVTENPEQAEAVLAAEQQGKDRSTLTAWLSEFIDTQASGDPAAKNDSTEKE